MALVISCPDSASRHISASTRTRCSLPQTMKSGPGRHLQSSSRCHRISTRCTGAAHSWQGGEASAISSALVIAFSGSLPVIGGVAVRAAQLSRRGRDCAHSSRARGNAPRVSCDRPARHLGNPCVPGSRALSSVEIRFATRGCRYGAQRARWTMCPCSAHRLGHRPVAAPAPGRQRADWTRIGPVESRTSPAGNAESAALRRFRSIGETGFEPATARPPAGAIQAC
jgi:hypothetical protein